MSRRTEVSDDVARAYRMWHQKHPKTVRQVTYDFPESIPVLGTALRIVYWSDKWEADDDGYFYEHDFDSRPPVYGEFHKRGAGARHVDTAKDLLKVPSVNSTMEFPILADAVELSIDVPGEGVRTLQFKRPPVMLCTKDRKALVILHERPIVIRGSRMRVTERGIVN